MAKLFAKENNVDLLISSTAKRAKRTAAYFADAFGQSKTAIELHKSLYACSVADFMAVINKVDDHHDAIMIFAHNPGLSELGHYLDQNFNDDLVTCSRVKIVFEVDSWQEISFDLGQVVEHDYPRKHPDSGC